jgi:hypothetical protein
LKICPPEAKENVKKGETISGVDVEKRISEVRSKINPGGISLHGRTLVKNVEDKFDEVFGLYIQICYTDSDGNRFYTSGSHDNMSLSRLNSHGEKSGWKKDEWK